MCFKKREEGIALHPIPLSETQITKTSKKNLTQIFPFHFLGDLNQLTGLILRRRTEAYRNIKLKLYSGYFIFFMPKRDI